MSTEINQSVSSRVKLLTDICVTAKKYYLIVEKYIIGMNPTLNNEVQSAIGNLTTTVDRLTAAKLDFPDTNITNFLSTVFNIYDDFSTSELAIRTILYLFDSEFYSRMILTEMSLGSHADIKLELNRAKTSYDKYILFSADDSEYFSAVNKLISKDNTSVDSVYEFVITHGANKFTIGLMKMLILSLDKTRKGIILNLVREMSDFALGVARISLNNESGIAGMIVSNRLKPVTGSISLTDLFKLFDIKYKDAVSQNENFKYISVRYNVCVCVLRCVSNSPIEFDFKGVIDLSYVVAGDLKVKFMSGLNKKILARYTTAVVLPKVDGATTEPIQIYGINNANTANTANTRNTIIIQTINGDLFRVLSVDDSLKTNLPQGFINGITTRPTVYSTLHTKNISRVQVRSGDMFDANATINLSRYADDQKIVPSSEPIKNLIFEDLRGFFTLHIKSIKSYRDMVAVLLSSRFREILGSIISLRIRGTNPNLDKPKSSEYLVTHISRLENLVSKFIKSIIRESSDESLSDRYFKESTDSEIQTMIIDTFINIVRKAANKLDSENLWIGYEMSLKEFLINNYG